MYYFAVSHNGHEHTVATLRDRNAALAFVRNKEKLEKVIEIYAMPNRYRLGSVRTTAEMIEKIQRDGKAMKVREVYSASN